MSTTIKTSSLSIEEMIEDEMLRLRCEKKQEINPASQPLNWKEFETVCVKKEGEQHVSTYRRHGSTGSSACMCTSTSIGTND